LPLLSTDDDWEESSDASGSKNSRSKKEAKRLRTEKTANTSLPHKAVKPIEIDDDQKKGTRDLYGPNENCFVIDARNIGNIGRYFNVRRNNENIILSLFIINRFYFPTCI